MPLSGDAVTRPDRQGPGTMDNEVEACSVNRTGESGDFILWERWSHVVSNEQEVPARTA